MTREQQFSKARRDGRRSASRTSAVRPTRGQRPARRGRVARQEAEGNKRKSRPLDLVASAGYPKRRAMPVANPEFYRPLKKPITLRLDADVLAWFKQEGRRYQTRINQALRQVMEKEVKKAG
jgi:uncharacterized protein (DUF4415 family)